MADGAHPAPAHGGPDTPPARLLEPLADATYRRLFAAQVVALVGTGVSTVALGLLAYELSGRNAGAVLGAAFALKMVAYVVLAPIAAAFADRLPRRRLLVGLDIARAGVVLLLPFVTEIWQVLVLVFALNACSAGFTPAFQAAIPDVLPDEERYTAALSLSRLAYDLQELLSPVLAGVLLLVVAFSELFVLNAVAFGASELLVLTTAVPDAPRRTAPRARLVARATEGIRAYLGTPRLRGLLALNLAAAAGSAMVIVNTVVLVRDRFDLGPSEVAVALAAAGAGSMAVALAMPRVLERTSDRRAMLAGGFVVAGSLGVLSVVPGYVPLLAIWLAMGIGLSLIQTPAGRLIQRSADRADRPALFAAQFSLSHACWLATYPIAGVLGALLGIDTVSVLLGTVAMLAVVAAAWLWRPEPAAVPARGRRPPAAVHRARGPA